MTKIVVQPNASGTGTFTIAAPNSNNARTLTLPDETGSVLTDQSSIEAQVKTATNATGSAPIYAARAWVNFNGTGTVAIRQSGNVSSITDNGTGDYTVTFTNAMVDADYAMTHSVGATASGDADDDGGAHPFTKTSSTQRVYVGFGNSVGNITFLDYNQIDLVFMR